MKKSNLILVLILGLALLLRVWKLDFVPVSLFGDEVDIGYHAYSLLKTGKDYSGNFLPLHLQSLADYKSPLYTYSIIPTVSIFGITPYGVRLMSALFGVLGVCLLYLLVNLLFKNKNLALLSSFLLSVTPWHIHYSRWGFEGGEMLLLFMAGLYAFLKSFDNKKWLPYSAVLFALTPAAYHSAKIFLPLFLVFLVVVYFKQIKEFSKKTLLISSIIFVLIITPFTLSTLFGGGADRFQSTSVFKSDTISGEIGELRVRDTKMSGKNSFLDTFFHNKIVYFRDKIVNNYLQAFSTDFLFIKGDHESRHNPSGQGEFYKFQFAFLILGLIFLFLKINDKKTKSILAFWILASPIASTLTIGGGTHASRLLLLLPPLVILISLGVYYSYYLLPQKLKSIFVLVFSLILFLSFLFWQHNYWTHYPYDSQKLWHASFKEAIQSAVSLGKSYDKIIISGADEPPLIFFLGFSQFDPIQFQQNYPLQKTNLEGIGEVTKLDKYYFTPIGQERGLYELGKILPEKSIYLATSKEVKFDLIKEPNRVPSDLTLLQSIPYPSGDGAFYIFTKK